MSDDRSDLNASGTVENSNVPEKCETRHPRPYYWSWYRLVFSDHAASTGDIQQYPSASRGEVD